MESNIKRERAEKRLKQEEAVRHQKEKEVFSTVQHTFALRELIVVTDHQPISHLAFSAATLHTPTVQHPFPNRLVIGC